MYLLQQNSYVPTSAELICTYFSRIHMYLLQQNSYVPTSAEFICTYFSRIHMYLLQQNSYVSTSAEFICTYFSRIHMYLLQQNSPISNFMRIHSAVSKVPTCRSSEGQTKKVKAQAHFVLYRFENTGKENKKIMTLEPQDNVKANNMVSVLK